MKTFLAIAAIASLVPFVGLAQSAEVYVPIPPERVTASASSEHRDFPAVRAVDGSGLSGNFHRSDHRGNDMWITEISRGKPVWLVTEFDRSEKIDLVEIWNLNQNQHTERGLRDVRIEYSLDGRKWRTLSEVTVPQAGSRKREPVSLAVETGGVDARFFRFTAAGNYYGKSADTGYYGLAEVRFSRLERKSVSELPEVRGFELKPSQGYLKTDDGPAREFTLRFDEPVYCGGRFTLSVDGRTKTIDIPASPRGVFDVEGTFPAGYMEAAARATAKFESPQGAAEQTPEIPAARRWTLWFLPHSHLDIGYTHRQADVMRLQWRNLERAIELAERTKDYPEGARYKWNAEATWPTMGYLEEFAGTQKAERLVDAIRCGDIGMDATLGSILTGISKQEELMHIFDDAHKIAEASGTEINTAMMSDVPGQSWGLVDAMAQNGVRYFSSGPNYVPHLGRMGSWGVGLYNLLLGDEPFWWQSASGAEKVLYWQTGKGYSLFHGWLTDKLSVCGVEPVWDYLDELESRDFPYSTTYLRYTIHGDNGPPDEQMPDVIRAWNEKYDSPHFVIGTTRELFTEFEREYGDRLPVYAGDMTPVWEDGAASTARELAMNRASAERLNQAEILWAMNRPAEFPRDEFLKAWKDVVLFSEHTWGAAGSGPEPESQFTKDLWAGKKMYADAADGLSRKLFDDALASEAGEFVRVFNTDLWHRSDVVRIHGVDLTGKELISADSEAVPVQRMGDGGWAFFARDIAPLSAAVYRVVPESRAPAQSSMAGANTLDNGRVRVEIDPASGTIRSLVAGEYEYAAGGLNRYVYSDREGAPMGGAEMIESVETVDDGPVAATVRIVSRAPGSRSLVREITVYRDIDRVDIRNTIDKTDTLAHENVRFAFPLNFPNPEVAMDLAMAQMYPERDQIRSSNKNFYSVLNGLSVSDIEHGMYVVSLDTPFVELGSQTADLARLNPRGTGWLNSATISADIYFWAMNNRWRTNYKASQGGPVTFRYSLRPFDPASSKLKKEGMEQARPLVATASADGKPTESLFGVKGTDRIAVSTIRPTGEGYIVRLQNTGAQPVRSAIKWGAVRPSGEVKVCDNRGNVIGTFPAEDFWMKPFETITIKL